MSKSENSKCVMVNDSNIPVSKRNYSGVRKSKGCAQLPELQKYIQTIIKANGELDPENSSASEKDTFPKEIKFGGNALYKGLDNKIKYEKVKFDMSRRKTKTKPKTPLTEAVSSGVEISNKFEDPRNWKFDRNQNLGHSLRIENFLKKLYPNPYNLASSNDFRKSKTEIIFEKVEKDDLRDGTLHDVVISKVDAQTEVDFQKPDKVIENAEIEKKSNEGENHENDISLALGSEKHNRSPAHNGYCSEDVKNPEATVSDRMPVSRQNSSSKNQRSNSASNISSRVSSLESISETLYKENLMNFKKRKNVKVKNKAFSGENLKGVVDKKFKNVNLQGCKKNPSDYDIGKLKLLNISDSDDSASKNFQLEKTHTENTKDDGDDELIGVTKSEICDELNKTNDLCDLLQIYSVMNKATESFLLLNSKNELMTTEFEILQNSMEDDKFAEFLNELNSSPQTPRQENKEAEKIKHPESRVKNDEIGAKNSNECLAEMKSVRNEERKIDKNEAGNLLNTAVKKEPELKNKSKEINTYKTKLNSKPENEISFSKTEKDLIQSESLEDFDEELQKKLKMDELDTNQKIDEVLQFMYDCLMKFNNQEKLLQEKEKIKLQDRKKINKKTSKKLLKENSTDAKNEKPSTSQLFKKKSYHLTTEKDSTENLSTKSLPDVKEIQNKYTAALDELNKKQNSRTYSKKRLRFDSFVPSLPHFNRKIRPSAHQIPAPPNKTASTTFGTNFDFDSEPIAFPDSFDVNNESLIQTVETLNELGGYAEETRETLIVSTNDLPVARSVLPLSVKVKKSKTDTCKALKDVLEFEEKLLADEFSPKESRHAKSTNEKQMKMVTCKKSTQILLKTKTHSSYSIQNDFEHPNSNFVICVNSFPRNLRTVTIRPSVPLPPPLTISVSDLKSWDLKPLTYYPKYRSKKLPPFQEKVLQNVLKFSYKVKEGALRIINKATVTYPVRPVGLKGILHVSEMHEEFSLKNSECYLKVKPMKKSLFVDSNNPETSGCYVKNVLTFKTSLSNLIPSSGSDLNINIKQEKNKSVEALIEALKEAEEKVFLLEKTRDSVENIQKSSESLCSCSASGILRNGSSENEFEKKRIQNLLLRTYNLQQKLHRYLHKITYVQPATVSCPLIPQEPLLDFGVFISNKADSNISLTEFEINQEHSLPLVHWYLEPPKMIEKSKTEPDEPVAGNVRMIDCGTSYNPPSEEKGTNREKSGEQPCEMKHLPSISKDEETFQKLENDEDDRSSTYSFKSSNDFSEPNETPNLKKETAGGHVSNGDLIKKLFSKIESFRRSLEEEKLKNQDKKCSSLINPSDSDLKIVKKQSENGLVEYDPKTTAKVLKTVFKGRKSSTELTIGLKDVPMTKVNNISVEKTKFSPNHTKISICISKEKPDELSQSTKINSELLHNQFSSYYFDHIRPSLSTCQTDYSKLNDNVSKSSQSLNELNEESDEDEDDYKSVGSNLGDSDTDGIHEEKSKNKERTTPELLPPRNITKHKFDFYRKMDLKKEDKAKQTSLASSWSRYKELEPLKQALTEMQIRMRSIKRDAVLSSNDYYERALKLAKMSAGFCQSCGTRAVIPDDTFGVYKTLLPRRCTHPRRNRPIRTALTPNSSFYSFRTGNAEVNDQFCDLNIKHSSSYLLNRTTHLRSPLHDMPILFERI